MRHLHIGQQDPQLAALLQAENVRQADGIELIASENIVSQAVLEAMGSLLTNKYSEGYPGHRYYGGNEVIDQIEDLARKRACALFGVPYANVQPYSGSPANFAVYVATCKPGDTVMGQDLEAGGHLTHGWKASATGIFFKPVQYGVKGDGYIDLDQLAALAREHKPVLIWVGATAYPREFPFADVAAIADEIGAYLAADIAHVAGLVVAGAHASPVPHAHIVTTTTHKTLRGPRGGMVLVTEKGLRKDPRLGNKIDQAIFPRLQGGPHNHTTAAMAVAFGEASTPAFKAYGHQIVANAKALAATLTGLNVPLVTDGTDNHMLLAICGEGRGAIVEIALDAMGLTTNKNTIPNEPSSAFYPSGIRIGTPSVTTRGMKEPEMHRIAGWIAGVMKLVENEQLPPKDQKEGRVKYLADLKLRLSGDSKFADLRMAVRQFCTSFPIPDSFV